MKLSRLKIGNSDLPFRIDYNVLEILEDEYGTVERFQMALIGFRWKRGEDGAFIKDDEGRPVPEVTTPSIKALKLALTAMVNEGLKAEAYEQKKEYIPMDPDAIIMECEIDRNYLTELIAEELERCQRVKKPIPGGAGKSRKRSTTPG